MMVTTAEEGEGSKEEIKTNLVEGIGEAVEEMNPYALIAANQLTPNGRCGNYELYEAIGDAENRVNQRYSQNVTGDGNLFSNSSICGPDIDSAISEKYGREVQRMKWWFVRH